LISETARPATPVEPIVRHNPWCGVPIRANVSGQVQRRWTITKDTKSTKGSANKTHDAIFRSGYVEVEQQPDLEARQSHRGPQLAFGYSFDLINTFQLNNQFVPCKNVDSISATEPDILVLYRLWVLEMECDPIAIQFMSQTLFACRFQQS
jgi:hypothetical protein